MILQSAKGARQGSHAPHPVRWGRSVWVVSGCLPKYGQGHRLVLDFCGPQRSESSVGSSLLLWASKYVPTLERHVNRP